MKVYVVTAGYAYEGDNVMGVYSSLNLARECIDEMEDSPEFHYDGYDIEEHEIDY